MRKLNLKEGGALKIAEIGQKYRGFHLQHGMMVLDKTIAEAELDESQEAIISSFCDDICKVFTQDENGNWHGRYKVVDRDFADILESIHRILATVEPRPAGELYTGDGFKVTDTLPGEKCNNGGEYGFYTSYVKTDIPGLYAVETSTTCDFDACGTGFEGFQWLTIDDYKRVVADSLAELRKASGCWHSPGLIDLFKRGDD